MFVFYLFFCFLFLFFYVCVCLFFCFLLFFFSAAHFKVIPLMKFSRVCIASVPLYFVIVVISSSIGAAGRLCFVIVILSDKLIYISVVCIQPLFS